MRHDGSRTDPHHPVPLLHDAQPRQHICSFHHSEHCEAESEIKTGAPTRSVASYRNYCQPATRTASTNCQPGTGTQVSSIYRDRTEQLREIV